LRKRHLRYLYGVLLEGEMKRTLKSPTPKQTKTTMGSAAQEAQ